jgi:hypothetical protein
MLEGALVVAARRPDLWPCGPVPLLFSEAVPVVLAVDGPERRCHATSTGEARYEP